MINLFISFSLLLLLGLSAVAFAAIRTVGLRFLEDKADDGAMTANIAKRLCQKPNRMRQVFILTLFVLSVSASYALYLFFSHAIAWGDTAVLWLSFVVSLLLVGFFTAVGLEYGESARGYHLATQLSLLHAFWDILFRPFILGIGFIALPLAAFMVEAAQEDEETIDKEVQHDIEEREKESEVLQNVQRLADRDAEALMTDRGEVIWIDINDDWDEIDKQIRDSGYTKFPICMDELDNVLGVLTLRDFIEIKDKTKENLKTLLSPAINVPEHISALRILDIFRKKRSHFAFVVDEFGTKLGIITLHDLVEYIFGDLPDEDDEYEEPAIVKRADGSLLVEGTIPIEELFDAVPLPVFEANDDEDYNTLAGYILSNMDEMPTKGDILDSDGYRFEIMDMDKNRIDQVLIAELDGKKSEK